MKRYISMLLALLMVLTLFGGVSAFAEEPVGDATPTATEEGQQGDPAADPDAGSDNASQTGTDSTDTDSTDTDSTDTDTADTDSADTDTADTDSTDTDTADTDSTDTDSTDTDSTDTDSTDTDSTDTDSTDADTADTDSTDTDSADTDAADTDSTDTEEDDLVALDAAAPEPPTSGGGSVTYTKIDSLADASTYVAFVCDGKAWYMDSNKFGSKEVTLSADGSTCEVSKGVSAKVELGSNGYTITLDDPPSTPNYLYVSGTNVAYSTTNAGYDKWEYKDGKLVYDGKYYLKSDFLTVTENASEAANITLYTGDKSSMDGGGGGGGSTTTDALAPTISTQPVGKTVKYQDTTTPDVHELTVAAQLPEDAPEDAELSYQWVTVGKDSDGNTLLTDVEEATSATFSADCYLNKTGVTTYQCKVSWTEPAAEEGGTETVHTTISAPASVVVYKEVDLNGIILFSDVHQEPENIGALLGAYMTNNGGNLPKLVFATGDYQNGGGTVNDPDTIAASLAAIRQAFGGTDSPIRFFYLGGNHETSDLIRGESYNNGTGLLSVGGNTYGTGVDQPVYIYTINYDEIESSSYEGIITNLETALANLAASKVTKPVLIIAHAGLHTLDSSEASGSYNVDYSDQMVDLLNKYGTTLDLYYFFGHNHSKGEAATYKTAGDTVISTYKYAEGARYNRQITLNFTYAHMGYLNADIGGGETATVMKVTATGATLQRVAAGKYGDSITTTNGMKDVPVVSALNESYASGSTLKAVVEGEGSGGGAGGTPPSGGSEPPAKPGNEGDPSIVLDAAPPVGDPGAGNDAGGTPPSSGGGGSSKFAYQWYKVTGTNLVSTISAAAEIVGATKSSYKPDENGYYFCKVTNTEDDSFATTTVAYVGEVEDDDEPSDTTMPAAGDYVIVMKSGDAYYALLSDASGALSAVEVKVENGEVVGPVGDDYIWHFDNPESGSVKSMNSGMYLKRTSAQSGGTASLTTTAKSDSVWVYDAQLHLLYNKTAGGSTSYFYPTITNGQLDLGKMSALEESDIYLMKVHTEASNAKPNTTVKAPATADGGHALAWAMAALTASAALTGIVIDRKKKNNA